MRVWELQSIFKSSKFTKWPGFVCVCFEAYCVYRRHVKSCLCSMRSLARSLTHIRTVLANTKKFGACVCECSCMCFTKIWNSDYNNSRESVSFTTIRTLTRVIFQSKSETRTHRNYCCCTSYNGGNLPLYHFTTSETTYHARPRI